MIKVGVMFGLMEVANFNKVFGTPLGRMRSSHRLVRFAALVVSNIGPYRHIVVSYGLVLRLGPKLALLPSYIAIVKPLLNRLHFWCRLNKFIRIGHIRSGGISSFHCSCFVHLSRVMC